MQIGQKDRMRPVLPMDRPEGQMERTDPRKFKLDPYASLLQSLLPGAKCFGLFDASGGRRWINANAQISEIREEWQDELGQVVTRIDDSGQGAMVPISDGHVAYAFPLGDTERIRLGTLVVLEELGSRGREPRSLHMVAQLLRPALHWISRDMLMQKALAKTRAELDYHSAELSFVRGMEQIGDPALGIVGAIESTLDKALALLGSGCLLISVPDQRLRIVRVSGGSSSPLDASALERAERNLLAWTSMHKRSVCLPSTETGKDFNLGFDQQPLLACPMPMAGGGSAGVLVAFGQPHVVHEKRRQTLEALARRLSSFIEGNMDPLTGAITREAFEAEINRLARSMDHKSYHALVYIDLDRLSQVNDEFGHQAGDEVLGHFASLIRGRLQRGQLFSRLGGDSFALLLPWTRTEEAVQQARQLCQAVTSLHYLRDDRSVRMSASIGVAEVTAQASHSLSALGAAETACRSAKSLGGNRVEVFEPADASGSRPQGDIYLANYLGRALEDDLFRLVVQPVHGGQDSLSTGYFEVFLRLLDANGLEMPPGRFLPVAERFEMLPSIDRWVVSHLLKAISPVAEGLLIEGAFAGVNLSAATVADSDFTGFLEQQLDASGVSAELLCFEIPEAVAMMNPERTRQFMQRLKDLGCRIALDDFGSGLSLLPYLDTMPVDFVKIDGASVMGMQTNRASRSMVAAINQAARVLNMTTVAEGVESDAARVSVCDMGVDLVQGFQMSRPEPLDAFIQRHLDTAAGQAARAGEIPPRGRTDKIKPPPDY